MHHGGSGLAGAAQEYHQWRQLNSLPCPLCQCEVAVLQTPRAHAVGAQVLLLSVRC